jgi:hypothetical protein
MILGDVEETVTSLEIDEETFEEIIKVRVAYSPCWWDGGAARRSKGAAASACVLAAAAVRQYKGSHAGTAAGRHCSCLRCSVVSLRPLHLFPPPTCPQTNKRMLPYLFVRGDGVILVSPPLRS